MLDQVGEYVEDLGLERDGVALAAEASQHLDQLRGGRDVQLAVDDEQAIPAEVGDLRDLPADGAG